MPHPLLLFLCRTVLQNAFRRCWDSFKFDVVCLPIWLLLRRYRFQKQKEKRQKSNMMMTANQ